MAASAETTSLDETKALEEWAILFLTRGKVLRNFRAIDKYQQHEPGPWSPTEVETDPESEAELMQKMQSYIQKLESSDFYQAFIYQMTSPEMSDRFSKVLGSEGKMKMVIYGIGSIESYESPRLQLSLGILLKRKFAWIEDVIEVFDPIISLKESRVMSALGCSVLTINEKGRRRASKPTLFFMPHCLGMLYNNLLQTNWEVNALNQIVILGNSFEAYERIWSVYKTPYIDDTQKYMLASRRFSKELAVDIMSDDFRAFHTTSWHFFSLHSDEELQIL